MITVYQLTTVHPFHDNRIYEKMVHSAVESGLRVVYVVTGPKRRPAIDRRIKVIWLSPYIGLLGRLVRMTQAARRIWARRRGIIHFHDPELIPLGIVSRFLGWRVIYDIHEDNSLGVLQKEYIPRWIRSPMALAVSAMEWVAQRLMFTIIAERCYQHRFPRATPVLNYPVLRGPIASVAAVPAGPPYAFIYTGTVSIDRGALHLARLAKTISEAKIVIVGRCDASVKRAIMIEAGDALGRMEFNTSEEGVSYGEIERAYLSRPWTAGLAIFPPTRHYAEKELTKFFEYMRFGIPIICSNFPAWDKFISDTGSGMTVSSQIDSVDILRIRNFCEDQRGRSINSKNGVTSILRALNWRSQWREVLRLYCSVFGQRRY